jgi:hypothetical protein
VIPLTCGIGLCSSNCPTQKKKGFTFSPTHIHRIETKIIIQIKNPKNSIEKTKKREKIKLRGKIEINKIFKN